MARETFGTIWNRVLLHAPNLPPPLAREFTRVAYNDIIDSHYWSELREDAEFLISDAYTTGTIALTNGSTTVTGTGTAFTSANSNNRQLLVDGIAPYYTVTYSSGTELTLDRAFAGADDASATLVIGDFYSEFPTDLRYIEKIRDQQNGWYLATEWFTQEYLDRVDAKRNSTGTPTMAVYAEPRDPGSGGALIPRYELWPRSTSERLYQYRYVKNAELTANSSRILNALKAETVIYGALKMAATYPGTVDTPNNLFGQDKYQTYSEIYERLLHNDTMNDIDLHQTMVSIADDVPRRFPFDAKYLQEHIW
jgi:hypothetical protein